jgi:hypothetical protein
MANAAPGVPITLTLAALAAATACGSGPVIFLRSAPMLIIAAPVRVYRRVACHA